MLQKKKKKKDWEKLEARNSVNVKQIQILGEIGSFTLCKDTTNT